MKTKLFLLFAIASLSFFVSCKKENSRPQITFTNNLTQGTANASGEYTLTGHISSTVNLDKVTLTQQGQAQPFLTDNTTAKNKNEYDYSYLITGITANTTIIMNVYDQSGGMSSAQFLILK